MNRTGPRQKRRAGPPAKAKAPKPASEENHSHSPPSSSIPACLTMGGGLLAELEKIVAALKALPIEDRENLDASRVGLAADRLLYLLASKSLGRSQSAHNALVNLFGVTRSGCKKLARLSGMAQPNAVLQNVALHEPEWPVMLSPKERSWSNAQKYLERLHVGEGCLIPTNANSRIPEHSPFTQFAAYLIQEIRGYPATPQKLALIEKYQKNLPTSSAGEMTTQPPAVALPALNKATWKNWWKVALPILKARFREYPEQERALIKLVAKGVEKHLPTKKTDIMAEEKILRSKCREEITRRIRKAFAALASRSLSTG